MLLKDITKKFTPSFSLKLGFSKVLFLFVITYLHERLYAYNTKLTFYRRSAILMQYHFCQKQPFRGVLRKRCPENIQQIYRRTPMPKYDFNKVAKQIY